MYTQRVLIKPKVRAKSKTYSTYKYKTVATSN